MSGSVPPIPTDDGWLLIYHAVEVFPARPFIYRAGAALLDRAKPSQVIARLPYPILESHDDRDHLARMPCSWAASPDFGSHLLYAVRNC